jgi:predicted transcriptional regulator
VAARMGTSQSAVARFESGDLDVRLSTVERYASALGGKLEWRIEHERR